MSNTPTIGDNTQVDYAGEQIRQLERDYEAHVITTQQLIEEAEAFPLPITDADSKGRVADLIKRIRDHSKSLIGIHEFEKVPHLRRGQAVDVFFFGMVDKIAKRDRRNRDGVSDVLQAELTAYDSRVLAEEQARRRREAEEAARREAAARAEQERLQREAEERRLAAERARKPETQAAKTEAVVQAEAKVDAATVEATLAQRAAEDAYVETLARPADLMRQRTAGGTLATVAQEPYAEIEDKNALDMALLWPFLKFDAIEAALRAYAKSTDYRTPMTGARIGRRPKSVVR